MALGWNLQKAIDSVYRPRPTARCGLAELETDRVTSISIISAIPPTLL